MRDPVPGLRPLFNKSNSAQRVELIVPAGAEICVPAEIAAQLPVEFVDVGDTTKEDQAAARAQAAIESERADVVEADEVEADEPPAAVEKPARGNRRK